MNAQTGVLGGADTAVLNWVIRHRRGLLVAMLALLHLMILQGVEDVFGRTLLLAHFGLFLIWQPFVQAESRVGNAKLLVMLLAVVTAVVFVSWWLLIVWLMLLAGIVGGRVFYHTGRLSKLFYLLALVYLMLVLLVIAVPHVIPQALASARPFTDLAHFGFPLIILLMAFLPGGDEESLPAEAIDLAYSIFVILLLSVLVLGSSALMLLRGTGYIESLLTMVMAGAAMLLLLSWVWNPSAAFSGIGAIASRYLLSVGLPLEQWLHDLAELAQREPNSIRFVEQACAEMVRQLAWVRGGIWQAEGRRGEFGTPSGKETTFTHGDLSLTLHTEQNLPPALVWHFNLVAQLLAEFHRAKCRDRQLRELAYLQAIHETGARLTHDVKNLLQTLNTLIFAGDRERDATNEPYRRLLDRQLPMIAQRLQQTMEKLGQPGLDQGGRVDASAWWASATERYRGLNVSFEQRADPSGIALPGDLFNSALENLLQNALGKRTVSETSGIVVTIDVDDGMAQLWVCDSGEPVPEEIVVDLGKRPVPSETGLGIGIYQLARTARLYQYRLELLVNRPGKVCFALQPAPGEAD
jgi:signal transduction histidine kinase